MNKSIIIISDFDGKIVVFNSEAEKLFKCKKSTILDIKRIYNLVHDVSIMGFIKNFESITCGDKEFSENTVTCLYPNGAKFYCIFKMVKAVDYLIIEVVKIKRSFFRKNNEYKSFFIEKVNIIFRSKFLMGSIIPFIFSFILSICKFSHVSYNLFFLLFISVILLHTVANTFNDYFDWISGRDKKNLDYVLFSTGGSRAIEFNIISEKNLLLISVLLSIIVTLIGVYFIYIKGHIILIIGLISLFSIYFYSAPPIHLASRYGLGELMHIFCLGPLITYGTLYMLTDQILLFSDFLIGIPFGLLITGCLLMNEHPDSKFDKLSGKINLAVLLGKIYIPYLYLLLFFSSFLIIFYGIYYSYFPLYFFLICFILPYGFSSIKSIFKIRMRNRRYVFESCAKSFNVYFFFSLILILLLIVDLFFIKIYPW